MPTTIHSTTLPNGLRVVTAPMASSETVTVMIMVRGGSRYETWPISGISHFMEHLFFKGGVRYPTTQDVSNALDGIGGESNAYTYYDKVVYYVKVAAQHLPVGLDVLSDMLLNATVKQEEIDRERNVVIEELNLYQDTPSRRIWELTHRLSFGDHPLGWDIGGTKDTVNGIVRDQLLSFRQTYYRPENMLVVAAGKVDPTAFAADIEKLFPLTGDAGKATHQAAPSFPAARMHLETKETEQAQVAWTLPGPKMGATDEAATEILTAILGGSMSSRLFIQVRERRGLCYSVRSEYSSFEDAGAIYSVAGVTLDKVDEAITTMRDEIIKLRDEGVTDAELARGREYLKGQFAIAVEDTATMADTVGRRALLLDQLRSPEQVYAAFDAVTKEQVNAAAKTWLDPAKATLTVLGPYKDAGKFEAMLP